MKNSHIRYEYVLLLKILHTIEVDSMIYAKEMNENKLEAFLIWVYGICNLLNSTKPFRKAKIVETSSMPVQN